MRRPQPRATSRVVDLTRDPMAPPELVTKAILDGLDETARQIERKWGVGRLRLLVDDALRAKFDAQKAKLDAAIATNQEIYIRAQAAGMRRAWQVLDRAATEASAQPLAPEVWECLLPSSGEVVSIVRTAADPQGSLRGIRAAGAFSPRSSAHSHNLAPSGAASRCFAHCCLPGPARLWSVF